MQLSQAQLDEFDNNGLIVLPQLFSKEEIAPLKTALISLFDNPHFANIAEQNGGAVRTAMALHQRNPVFKRLTGHPRLLEPAHQIAGPALTCSRSRSTSKQLLSVIFGNGTMILRPTMQMTACLNLMHSTCTFSSMM